MAKGLGKGARVAIMMPNVLQYPVTTAGILRAGMTVTARVARARQAVERVAATSETADELLRVLRHAP